MAETRTERLMRRQHETWNKMQEIRDRAEDEDRDLTAEERTNWDAANADLDTIIGDLRREQQFSDHGAVDRSQIIPTSAPVDPAGENRSEESRRAEYREAFNAYMRRGISDVTPRQRELLTANHEELPELRAQGGSANAAGGFLVPPEFQNVIHESLTSWGGVLQYCNVITTDSGAPLSWPTADDTANEGAILAENTQVAEQDVILGQEQIGAYTYTSKLVRVSWALLNDSVFDLEDFLGKKFGERLGRAYSRHLISGTGVSQPKGILTGLRVGAEGPAGATPSITFDNLVDLEHSIDPAYRSGGNCRYGMADKTLAMIRKVKDNDGRPLWVPIPAPGFGPTINGHPYFIDNSMADPAVGGVAAVFGDFRAGMLVRQVQGIQSVRLNERYADFLQTGFFAFSRMDAAPDDRRALAGLKFGAAA